MSESWSPHPAPPHSQPPQRPCSLVPAPHTQSATPETLLSAGKRVPRAPFPTAPFPLPGSAAPSAPQGVSGLQRLRLPAPDPGGVRGDRPPCKCLRLSAWAERGDRGVLAHPRKACRVPGGQLSGRAPWDRSWGLQRVSWGEVGCPWHLRLQCTEEVLGRGPDVGQVCRTSFIVHGAAALCQGSLRPERQVLYWFPPHR